ncbi:MAG: RNA-binding domain-containing protein [Anaerolineae bacterium]|mgnify:CR=1 FL=1
MSIDLVMEGLNAGEGLTVEFKERYSSHVIETLTAFANTQGGQVLIGVTDSGQVVGLADPNKVIESVLSACREAISPPLSPQIEAVKLTNGTVVLARVESTGRMHAKGGAVFIRHGRQTRRASNEEIRLLTLRETPEVFERLPATGSGVNDLDLQKLRAYFAAATPRALTEGVSVLDLAVSARLAVVQAGQTLPTNAGMVLFGQQPQRYNVSWGVTALRIRGRVYDRNLVTDRRELVGTAAELIEAGQSFVGDHMKIAYRFLPGDARRQDVPEYSLDALREALANAVAHRDYQPAETVQLRIFDDRLEVQSPGGLLPGLALPDLLRGGIARRRNEVISEVLRQIGYVEKAGFGMVFIQERCRQIGASDPQFVATPSHFVVTLPANGSE